MTEIETHDALPEGVYLVQVWHAARGKQPVFKCHAVFSVFARAEAWMKSLPEDYSCYCAPFVLDNPDAGDIQVEAAAVKNKMEMH